jgi:hypothetical protein
LNGCLATTALPTVTGRAGSISTRSPAQYSGCIDVPCTRQGRRLRSAHRTISFAITTSLRSGHSAGRDHRRVHDSGPRQCAGCLWNCDSPQSRRSATTCDYEQNQPTAGTQATSRFLDSQNILWIFSTAAIRFSAAATSTFCLVAEHNLVADQKVSCRSGNASRWSGLK